MERTYPNGVPSWVDVEQPDPQSAARFYGQLFGWTIKEAAPGWDYLIASVDGQDVAGLAAGETAGWNTYVAVDDADASGRLAAASGGVVVAEPADIGSAGRMAIIDDPTGARFRMWQAGRRLGAQLVNTPVSWNFSNLHTPDRDAAMAFYRSVFGWVAAELGGDAGAMIQLPGYGDHLASTIDPDIYQRQASAPPGFADVIAGLAMAGPGEAARWHVVFTVAERDATASAAERLGGTVLSEANTTWTKEASVRDPQGAEFTISQFTPPTGDW